MSSSRRPHEEKVNLIIIYQMKATLDTIIYLYVFDV